MPGRTDAGSVVDLQGKRAKRTGKQDGPGIHPAYPYVSY
jgi:hypothetical protein